MLGSTLSMEQTDVPRGGVGVRSDKPKNSSTDMHSHGHGSGTVRSAASLPAGRRTGDSLRVSDLTSSETTSSRILQTSSHPVSLVSRLPAGVPLTAGPFLPRLDVGLRPSRSSRRVQHVDGLTAFALATPGPS